MRFLSNAQRIGLLGALLIAGSSQADHTPEVALAELKIASLSSRVIGVAPKAVLSCAVKVELVQDDSALNTVLVVLVPPTTFVEVAEASQGNCERSPTATDPHGPVHGHVICRLGTLNPGGPKTATVKIQGKQLTKRHSRLGCSAFVYSDRPDRNHKDNFKPHI